MNEDYHLSSVPATHDASIDKIFFPKKCLYCINENKKC